MVHHPPRRAPKGPFWTYKAINDQGQLLYLGETNAPTLRFIQHQETKHWYREVASWPIDLAVSYPTLDEVLAAEAAAIRAEKPLFNIEHNEGNPNRVDPHTMRYVRTGRPYRPDLYGHVHQARGRRVAPVNPSRAPVVRPRTPTRPRATRRITPVHRWAVVVTLASVLVLAAESVIAPPVGLGQQLLIAATAGAVVPAGMRLWWRSLSRRQRRRVLAAGAATAVLVPLVGVAALLIALG